MPPIYANRYEFIKQLGKGMTGEVVLAKDLKTGWPCALKLLREVGGDVDVSVFKDFQSEFETLKNLNHPSVAKVYDAGMDDASERLYISTEFVEGAELFEATENQPIEFIEALFVQALRALNYLHSQKVYHLDIKPLNLLVSYDANSQPTLKIIDFGLANYYERKKSKKSKNDQAEAENWTIIDTAAFTAPEIIAGQPYNGQADLYSLACTFYKAFTRELPFKGATQEDVHDKHLFEIPKPPSEINSKIPAYLDKILLKLLEKYPDKRYADGKSVIEHLSRLSGKAYAVETLETRMSYLPKQGKMIGRDPEFKKFRSYYNDRIDVEFYRKTPYLIITGKKGTGKTRFLEECKSAAQKDFIKILEWDEFKKLPKDKVPLPCLIVGDDVDLQRCELEALTAAFKEKSLLAVLTTTQKSPPCELEHIVELNYFSKDLTRGYLEKATGLKFSEEKIDYIFQRTQGRPQHLTNYLRSLFERNRLQDQHGGWTQATYDDLGIDHGNLDDMDFIKVDLAQQLENLNLSEFHFNILYTMALAGKPTLQDLTEITCGDKVEQQLDFLVKKGVLAVNPEDHFIFTNPAYKDVLLQKIPADIQAEICDAIAYHLEASRGDKAKILHYRGRGHQENSAECLLELARLQKEQFLYKDAQENFRLLLNKENLAASMQLKAHLELGIVLTNINDYVQANGFFTKVINSTEKDQDENLETIVTAYLQLGVCCRKDLKLQAARAYYQQGLQLLQKRNIPWLQTMLESRIAFVDTLAGNQAQAEDHLQKASSLWQNKLSDEEKILAARCDITSIYMLRGEFQKSVEHCEHLLSIIPAGTHLEIYPLISYDLGCGYIKMGEVEKGEKFLRKTISILKTRGTPYFLFAIYNELGNSLQKRGIFEEALVNYLHAFDLAKKTSAGMNVYIIAYSIANVYLDLAQWSEAQEYFAYVREKLESLKNENANARHYLFLSLIGLANASRKSQDVKKAERALSEAAELLKIHSHLESLQQYLAEEKDELAKQRNGEAPTQAATTCS